MKPFFLACVLGVWGIAVSSAQNLDRIRFVDGKEATADILEIRGRELIVRRTLDFGHSLERYPLEGISSAEFSEGKEFDAVAKLPDPAARQKALAELWKKLRPFLAIPGSPSGRVGLVYARALAESPEPTEQATAMTVLTEIERNDPLESHRSKAYADRLLLLVNSGRLADVKAEAEGILSGRSDEPGMRAGASYALAAVHQKELSELEKENPRWEIDPRVRPERNRLYHRILELLLMPYLENGIAPEPAARGLWGAVAFHQATNNPEDARSLALDLVQIYPSTPEAEFARRFLSESK